MLLPVLDASDSWKNPCSSPQKMIRSSDSRLRCTNVIVHACRNRGHEIAIGRRVDAVGDDARKPEPRREHGGVDGVVGAGDGARSERHRVGFAATPTPSGRDRVEAPRRARERSAPPAPAARAGDACTTASPPARRIRACRQRRHHGGELPLQQRNAAPEIQPEIERHLFVARSSGVQALAEIADALDELALDERVHVLVGAVDECGLAPAAIEDFVRARP